MATPEGRVKDAVKKIIAKHKELGVPLYAHWPVINGMGSPELDCNLAVNGYAMSIETKAPGEGPTPRQWITIGEKQEGGVLVMVTDGDPGELEDISRVIALLADRELGTAHSWAASNIQMYIQRKREKEERAAKRKPRKSRG